jgi:hypothetical protein
VVVTVPFGPSFSRHERRVFYPASLLWLVARHATPTVLEVIEGYLCAVAEGPADDGAIAAAERLLVAVQPAVEQALHDAHRGQLLAESLRADIDGLRVRSSYLLERAEDAETRLNRFREQRELLRTRLGERDERIRSHKEREARMRARAKAYRRNLAKARSERDKYKRAMEKERWRVESMQARKWWRLGQLLRSLATPKGIVRFPKRFAALVLKPSPRPKPPQGKDG